MDLPIDLPPRSGEVDTQFTCTFVDLTEPTKPEPFVYVKLPVSLYNKVIKHLQTTRYNDGPPKVMVKGCWTKEEDDKLVQLVQIMGPKCWNQIATQLPGRLGKQCRERYINHLDPKVCKDKWGADEDKTILEAHKLYGNQWSKIARLLPRARTANAVKNHYNSSLRKQSGMDGLCQDATEMTAGCKLPATAPTQQRQQDPKPPQHYQHTHHLAHPHHEEVLTGMPLQQFAAPVATQHHHHHQHQHQQLRAPPGPPPGVVPTGAPPGAAAAPHQAAHQQVVVGSKRPAEPSSTSTSAQLEDAAKRQKQNPANATALNMMPLHANLPSLFPTPMPGSLSWDPTNISNATQ
eukprot:TRINITY_DN54315_c0_g1_i1.p1 TRINITY_DN54315_c0_g1~~TRINITY_DN54315_c0_g1_i1.p1  ORF type:complete len:379 (+),score=36.03 TRINITY_DN54315_c0_g1_i1:95-1138(+)